MKQYLHLSKTIDLYYNPDTENININEIRSNKIYRTVRYKILHLCKLKYFCSYWTVSFVSTNPKIQNAIRLHFPKNF